MFPIPVVALQTFADCTKPLFLGILVPWYQYLNYAQVSFGNDKIGTCAVQIGQNGAQLDGTNILGSQSPFLLIGLAIIDDLLRIATLVAVGYVIYGGVQYITSGGSPESTKQAQNTIINALIGLVLAILAASIVAFIGSRLGAAQGSGG